MQRRQFISGLGAGLATGTLAGCSQQDCSSADLATQTQETFEWKMVTTWPPNLPGLGVGANNLAQYIDEITGGRIQVKVYAANELVPALEVFDSVSRGTAEMGHGGAYYWKGKSEATQFFGAVPFGMNAQEMNGWLYYGGGLALWRELYAPFNLVPFSIGHTGTQMGGWFNKQINTLDDIQGLKMRIPGLGGEVFKRAGGTPVLLPGSEIFTSLQTGNIDATEWVGPYNDIAFAFQDVAKYYYYPGWHEPTACLEAIVNKEAFDALPGDLKAAVDIACKAATNDMLADFTAHNHTALQSLMDKGVEMRKFPDEILQRFQEITTELLQEKAANDEMFAKIYQSYSEYQASVMKYHAISEQAYYAARGDRSI